MDAVAADPGTVSGPLLPRAHRNGAAVWFATMIGWVLSPPKPGERGLVTVEFIFGIVLVIAIITVVVSVIHRPAMGDFFLKLIQWLLNLIRK
jgi:hypothetical protein